MRVARLAQTVVLWGIGVLFLLPLYWLFVSSLKSDAEITRFPPTFWPETFVWSNFPEIWKQLHFHVSFLNSLTVTVKWRS